MIRAERIVWVRYNRVKTFVGENLVTCDKLVSLFPYKVYENLEIVRPYSNKRGIENKQKYAFLLISANKG